MSSARKSTELILLDLDAQAVALAPLTWGTDTGLLDAFPCALVPQSRRRNSALLPLLGG